MRLFRQCLLPGVLLLAAFAHAQPQTVIDTASQRAVAASQTAGGNSQQAANAGLKAAAEYAYSQTKDPAQIRRIIDAALSKVAESQSAYVDYNQATHAALETVAASVAQNAPQGSKGEAVGKFVLGFHGTRSQAVKAAALAAKLAKQHASSPAETNRAIQNLTKDFKDRSAYLGAVMRAVAELGDNPSPRQVADAVIKATAPFGFSKQDDMDLALDVARELQLIRGGSPSEIAKAVGELAKSYRMTPTQQALAAEQAALAAGGTYNDAQAAYESFRRRRTTLDPSPMDADGTLRRDITALRRALIVAESKARDAASLPDPTVNEAVADEVLKQISTLEDYCAEYNLLLSDTLRDYEALEKSLTEQNDITVENLVWADFLLRWQTAMLDIGTTLLDIANLADYAQSIAESLYDAKGNIAQQIINFNDTSSQIATLLTSLGPQMTALAKYEERIYKEDPTLFDGVLDSSDALKVQSQISSATGAASRLKMGSNIPVNQLKSQLSGRKLALRNIGQIIGFALAEYARYDRNERLRYVLSLKKDSRSEMMTLINMRVRMSRIRQDQRRVLSLREKCKKVWADLEQPVEDATGRDKLKALVYIPEFNNVDFEHLFPGMPVRTRDGKPAQVTQVFNEPELEIKVEGKTRRVNLTEIQRDGSKWAQGVPWLKRRFAEVVTTLTPAADRLDFGNFGDYGLSTDKLVYQRGDKVKVQAVAEKSLGFGTWVGLVRANVPSADYSRTTREAKDHKVLDYLFVSDELEFEVPEEPGIYDVRLYGPSGRTGLLARARVRIMGIAPVVSEFETGTESWKVVDAATSERKDPDLVRPGQNSTGYVASREPFVKGRPMDLVIVFDTTGSMRESISSVKTAAQELVKNLQTASPSLRVGLVNFRDLKEDGAQGLVAWPLSTDVTARINTIGGWDAGGGGSSFEESMYEAVVEALELQWRRDHNGAPVAKAIVVITDAPSRAPGQRGRTQQDIIRGAVGEKVGVHFIRVGNDATLSSQASRIAMATSGTNYPATQGDKVGAALQSAVSVALEQDSPRYWNAPAKFLGDQSAYYGTMLEFKVRQFADGPSFDAPDVIIRGGPLNQTMLLRGFVRPSENWTKVIVPLNEDGNWKDDQYGRDIRPEEIKQILADVKEIKIRAEFAAGPDTAYIDGVTLGSGERPTHVGMTPLVRRTIESLDAWKRSIKERLRLLDELYDSENLRTRLQAAYKSAGFEYITEDYTVAGDIENFYRSVLTKSPREMVYEKTLQSIDHAISVLGGQLNVPPRQLEAINKSMESWLAADKAFIDLAQAFEAAARDEAIYRGLSFKSVGTGQFQEFARRQDAATQAKKDAKDKMDAAIAEYKPLALKR